MKKANLKVTDTELLSPTIEAKYGLGKALFNESLSVYSDFSKTMISLSSSFCLGFFGLLKLLGVNPAGLSAFSSILTFSPPVLFITTCIIFMLSYFPRSTQFTLDDPVEVERVIDRAFRQKRVFAFFGSAFFVAGLVSVTAIIVASFAK